jgi:hypothetical protein
VKTTVKELFLVFSFVELFAENLGGARINDLKNAYEYIQ